MRTYMLCVNKSKMIGSMKIPKINYLLYKSTYKRSSESFLVIKIYHKEETWHLNHSISIHILFSYLNFCSSWLSCWPSSLTISKHPLVRIFPPFPWKWWEVQMIWEVMTLSTEGAVFSMTGTLNLTSLLEFLEKMVV